VAAAARILRPLASPAGLEVQALLGLGCLAVELAAAGRSLSLPAGTGTLALSLCLLLVSTLWHELGHAAVLARAGHPPGQIGAGWLVFYPVLYCDVSAACLLPRRQRCLVDAAGAIFQLAAAGSLLRLGRWLDLPACTFAGWSALLAVAWSLLPFVRADGYWLICDLLGVADLERPLRLEGAGATSAAGSEDPGPAGGAPAGRRLLVWFVILHRLGSSLFLLVVYAWLPGRLLRLLPVAGLLGAESAMLRCLGLALGVIASLLLLIIAWGTGRRIAGLFRANRADLSLLR
jgi:hypothetical protein